MRKEYEMCRFRMGNGRPDPVFRDIRRYSDIKHKSKAERNQNIANAFYQGGHAQTAIALAFEVSSSTVSRVIKEFENGG